MPTDEVNAGTGNGNMPAIWMLNAQIPNTIQYGAPQCSCWTTGCGELDIFEVLAGSSPACNYAKSTLHGNIPMSGGNSDYFERPTGSPITVGLVMYENNIHIRIMDDFDWPSNLDPSTINGVCDATKINGGDNSVFQLAQ